MLGKGSSRRGDDDSRGYSKRPRVLIACQRCKSRRQKCDNATPSCSNCARSKAECVFSEKTYSSSYVKSLEERLAALEGRSETLESSPDRPEPREEDPQGSSGVVPNPRDESITKLASNRLTLGLGVLSSCAAAEPHYFGFSSGLSLAHFVQTAIDAGHRSGPEVSLPLLADRPFSNQIPTLRTPLASPPSTSLGNHFVKAYLSIIHPLYPFLDRKALWKLHEDVTRSDRHETVHSKLDLAVLHLVYAIGSRCLQLLGSTKVSKDVPEGHFVSAMERVPDVMRFTSIRSIEITLLLGLHSMRSPSGGSVWHLCGLAIRQCLELGLHKERAVQLSQLRADQMRKRLFWSAVILERKTALVLGRPFAVSEKEVDAHVPLNVDDDEERLAGLEAAGAAEAEDVEISPTLTTLSIHRHHVLLYRIHTKIRSTLHHLKNSEKGHVLARKIATRFQELEEWKRTVLELYSRTTARSSNFRSHSDGHDDSSDSDSTRSIRSHLSAETEKTELLLEYFKARRSLLQPLMTEGHNHYPFGASEYASCAEASGQVCQLYRKLHRLAAIPFTLRDLHAVFVAGFTLIYCICAQPVLYDVKHAGDLGACSAVLHVITGQWSSAKRYRDAFEIVVEKVLERTRDSEVDDGPTCSTLSSKQRDEDAEANRSGLYQKTISYPDSHDSLNTSTPMANDPEPGSNPIDFTATTFGLDFEGDLADIGGLLLNEGMDWFTEVVL